MFLKKRSCSDFRYLLIEPAIALILLSITVDSNLFEIVQTAVSCCVVWCTEPYFTVCFCLD